ncbi:calcium/sodium antiporter [Opitutaceae bacterium]|nr:calcium/sodium antiporter [Opitutaceae bacterium]
MSPFLALLIGLVVLTLGAELLVRGSSALALRLGLTPLVVGLTVVAFGTSAPELVVSLQAAQKDSAEIAVGNVVGSNLCNLALILGLCALIRPLTTNRSVIWREVPILIGATLIATLFLIDGDLGPKEGFVLVIALFIYTTVTIRQARRDPDQNLGSDVPQSMGLIRAILFTVGGMAALLYGSDLFVEGAVELAYLWGWSEAMIGLTIVAIGTSLPELAISVVAVKNGETNVAIGNVVGSSLFNLMGILGVATIAAGGIVVTLQPVDLAMLVVVTLALWPLVQTGHRIDRREGAALLFAYLAYAAWLFTARYA